MTATTTADILTAWELIEEHGLDLLSNRGGSRTCVGPQGVHGTGLDDVAAVKAWAEAAGVPWPSVKVVPMWCSVGDVIPPIVATANRYAIEGYVVPCDVVIREPEGV